MGTKRLESYWELKLSEMEVGKRYIIDAEFSNGGEVELVKIYGKYYCRVKDIDTNAEWDTMLYRLTEKLPNGYPLAQLSETHERTFDIDSYEKLMGITKQ